MKVVAVVGSGSGAGKTTLVCRLLEALPGLAAVKISPRDGDCRVEWGPGEAGKDTARYAASGAAKVARIVGPRSRVAEAWDQVRRELGGLRGAVVEGASALSCEGEKLTILVLSSDDLGARPERDTSLLAAADAITMVVPTSPDEPGFHLAAFSHYMSDRPFLDLSTSPPDIAAQGRLIAMVEGFLRR